jgi:hypothetical protein
MKKLTLFAVPVFLVLWSNLASAADLKPFDDVRAQYQSYRDPTRVSYLFNRCAALQLNVSALLLRQGEKKGAQDFENLAHHYMVLSEANEREIDKKRGVKSKDLMKTVSRNVANVSEIYSRRVRENYVKRGEYLIGDAQLEAELAECNLPDVFKSKLTAN